ncbi:hypothetical protein EVAR_6016_1 [Eumeta japonica]|uniref:Uncharacterized protein n=1 Tax=Eumeta variegata TaxID=151549 RepID=A0A4C1TD07_EUMVA|nr:hypothetical protein EVAR_6016_1 [Eumeta japonica]
MGGGDHLLFGDSHEQASAGIQLLLTCEPPDHWRSKLSMDTCDSGVVTKYVVVLLGRNRISDGERRELIETGGCW